MDNPPPRNRFNTSSYDNNLEAQHEELKRFASFNHHIKPIELETIISLFTQPAPQGRPSRFSSHRKGAGLPHPIRGGRVWSTVLDGVGTSDRA